jgi:hypothetical protein
VKDDESLIGFQEIAVAGPIKFSAVGIRFAVADSHGFSPTTPGSNTVPEHHHRPYWISGAIWICCAVEGHPPRQKYCVVTEFAVVSSRCAALWFVSSSFFDDVDVLQVATAIWHFARA